MSSARGTSSRRTTTATGSILLLVLLAFKANAVYSSTITVRQGGKIQDALDNVQAGDTIEIESGEYYEDIRTAVHGLPDGRITVRAAGGSSNRETVVLRGAGGKRVFEINHDYYTIENFTIDGENLEVEANDDNYKTAFRDKTLYVVGDEEPTMRDGGYLSAVDGLIIRFMIIKNAGGECIRLRYFVTYAEVYENELETCGLYDWEYNDGGDDGKNGEGIYIGTSSNQWNDGKIPSDGPDVCLENVIRDNVIRTKGSEGVEVKEGSIGTTIESNTIYMQKDPDSGGVGSRGDGTIIRYNHIEDADGAGVRLGGHTKDGITYGLNNQVYGNTMVECVAYGVKVMEWPQGQICENDIELPTEQDGDEYKFSGGTYAGSFDPREACDSNPTPSTPSPTTTPRTNPTPSPVSATPSPRTPSPTDGTGSDLKYLGCFADVRGSRTMSFGYKDLDGMSNEECIDHCRGLGKSFAGTLRGYSCRCSNSSTRISRNGESTDCTTACSGDDSEVCGGWLSVSTWEV